MIHSESKPNTNIEYRMWIFYYTAEGLACAKKTSLNEKESAFLQKAAPYLKKRESILEENLERMVGTNMSGYIIDDDKKNIFIRGWMQEIVEKNTQKPSFVFIRNVLDLPKIYVMASTSCLDYVFFLTFFNSLQVGQEYSFFYRNSQTLLTALQVQSIPNIDILCHSWDIWAHQMGIVAFSPRFLLTKRNGMYGLYTLGISSSIMTKIQETGMEWNRKYQVWTHPEHSMGESLDVILDLIRCDNLPNVHTLGYVPEWICHTQQGEDRHVDTAHENQIFWNMLNGQE